MLGVVVHVVGAVLPVQVAMVGLGVGVIGAGFMLAWAADAGEAVFSGGLVLAVIALLAVLPEFVIEIRLAFTQQADLVTANLTGATRLLLTGATALPLLVAYLARRGGRTDPALTLDSNRRLELAILLLTSLFAIQIVVRGDLTVFDGVILLALYVTYARRVQGTQGEEPAVVGVAAGLLSLPRGRQRAAIIVMVCRRRRGDPHHREPIRRCSACDRDIARHRPVPVDPVCGTGCHRGTGVRHRRRPGGQPPTRPGTGALPGLLGEPVDARTRSGAHRLHVGWRWRCPCRSQAASSSSSGSRSR